MVLIKGCEFANDLIGSDEIQEKKPVRVVEGQNGYLIQNTFFAIDEERFNELISYIVAGFTQSYIEVVSTGMRGYVEV